MLSRPEHDVSDHSKFSVYAHVHFEEHQSHLAIFRARLLYPQCYLTVKVHIVSVRILVDVSFTSGHKISWIFEIRQQVLVQSAPETGRLKTNNGLSVGAAPFHTEGWSLFR